MTLAMWLFLTNLALSSMNLAIPRRCILLLSSVKGVSLERIHPDLPQAIHRVWQSAAQAAGFATPRQRTRSIANPLRARTVYPHTSEPSPPMATVLMMSC